ncbi:thioredoxin domain-containing protein [Frigoribacterium sp. CG_9.8]|uniref:DsbA family protein n=1 Tax=Frigoribacterium sp. CG_9.8 TaxID=2787733 RepID=UPI0018C9EB6E|nr:thioredoxin domain-containing protein [Frigoribacterium sp. CG_9.8]MBG6107262.1 protein-disulfide isomerase [Frigoribacterium sp. CG_9.8]
MAASGTSPSSQGKKDRREAARETARLEREAEKKRQRRNKIFLQGGIGIAILAVIAVVVAIVVQPATPGAPGPRNMASSGILFTGQGGVATATTTAAAAADGKPKATQTNTSDGLVHIVTYVDWACPACKTFEATYASQIQQLVASGSATLEVHPISILDRNYGTSRYATRAANAAACVANYQPAKFLDTQKEFYDKQPTEGTSGLTDTQIKALVTNAGVTDSAVTNCINTEQFTDWIGTATQVTTANTALVNAAAGGFSTPTVIVNGKRWDGSGDFLQFVSTAAGTATPSPSPSN